MKTIGVVKDIKNDIVTIAIKRASGCGGSCDSCQASCETTEHLVNIYNNFEAEIGEVVEMEFDEKKTLIITVYVYLIPFLFMILFGFLSSLILKNDLFIILSALFGLVISFFVVFLIDKTRKNRILEVETKTLYKPSK